MSLVGGAKCAGTVVSFQDTLNNVARSYIALASENEALEGRVRALRAELERAARYLNPSGGMYKRVRATLAADDAKAAGEPTITVAQATEREDHERSDGSTQPGGNRPRQSGPDDAPDGADQHDQGTAERAEVTRAQHCDHEAGGGVPLGGPGPGDGHVPVEHRVAGPDDRASRRLAYVREKAPVILAGQLQALEDATLTDLRLLALEQAGLIFDETEQSE